MLQEIDFVKLTGIGVVTGHSTATLTIKQEIAKLVGIGVLHMHTTATLTMLETVIILVPITVLVDTIFAPVIMDTSPNVDQVEIHTFISVTEEYITTPVEEITQALFMSATVKLVIHNMLDLFNLYQIL